MAGDGSFFPEIQPIAFAGPESDNVLSYRYYDADEVIMGKKMRDWLRFSVCYWHTFRGNGLDPFGKPTINRPWDDGTESLDNALRRVRAAFEFFQKLGVDYYTFHDVDVSPEGATLQETFDNLDKVTDLMLELQAKTGIKLLWGTANLFSHPRYMCGASTNPDPLVFARAAAQVKKAIDVTHKLGGQGFVFWGGREGYAHIINTDMTREMGHYAQMLKMAVAYKKSIGFSGQILVEPKPREPMKHQYDYDAQTVLGFLHQHGLYDEVMLNIEPNHTQLAGHEFEHDIILTAQMGKLGSIDANTGSESLGWDTDEFIVDHARATLIAKAIIEMGGFTQGGLNFDAKVRRESTDVEDMFIAHIASIDALAKGLRNAVRLLEHGRLPAMLKQRYAGFDEGLGKQIEEGNSSLEALTQHCLDNDTEPPVLSGKQEKFQAVFNHYL
ncbi:Xylose isomerase [Durusdinium trenchii]|uniref:Xylose isomerase n=1 Tax=Durusdinium trenchii TaxID=1381693 RepID=A0ABP0HQ20_9DINO